MDEDSFKQPYFGYLTRSILSLAIIFLISFSIPCDIQDIIPATVEAPLVCMADIRTTQRATSETHKQMRLFHNKRWAERLFHPIIIQAASRYEVDPALVKAVIMAESSYNHLAISKKGAIGLMQLMPKTAEYLGVKDSFNPEHNINGGVKYLKQLIRQFDNNIELALAAYNAGSTKVRRYQGIPPIKATHCYVDKVIEYYRYYKTEMAVGVPKPT